ncbi:MAG TPA: ornithine cyclodeaminase family protein [Methanospirillum sp.]|nr:ornithine cyclodeaminase family protein [Methanospirillum sp.]
MRYYHNPHTAVHMRPLIDAVRMAFIDHGHGVCEMPPKSYVNLPGGDFRTMPSYLPSLNCAGVKIVNVHPENRRHGLPTVMAVTLLISPETGMPEAVLNATTLTAMRTGASAAIATAALSPAVQGVLGIIGAGEQALFGLTAIRTVFDCTEIRIWSRKESTAQKLVGMFPDLDIRITDIERASDADLLLTVTPSTKPLIKKDWIHEGTHINAIGADAPGKQELDPELLISGQVFVDDREQAIHSGEINVPIRTGSFRPDQIAGTLGEVLIGKAGRKDRDAITIFDSTGIAITDLAAAALALKNGEYVDLPFL